MKIANVVHDSELVNHTKVQYVNYINEPKSYNEMDKTLPTLYVGWSFMKVCNPDNKIIQNADILNKQIINNELYWEFSFIENKPSHVKGVDNFVSIAPELYFSPKYKYVNIDPVFHNLKTIDDFINVIPKEIDVSYNYKNEMIYLLSNNIIYGINLQFYDFFRFDVDQIIENLLIRTTVAHIDLNAETYQHFYKIFPNYTRLKRYLVTILSK